MQGCHRPYRARCQTVVRVLSSCERDSTLSVQPCASPEAQLILAWYALSPTALLRQHLHRLKNSSGANPSPLPPPADCIGFSSVNPCFLPHNPAATRAPVRQCALVAVRCSLVGPLFLRNFPFFFPKIYALHS